VTEQAIFFTPRAVPGIQLEGRLLDGKGPPCIVSHPHPLAGGDMDHPIVVALWRAAAEAGYAALRYNFRGVGRSGGSLTPKSPLAIADLEGALDRMGAPAVAIGYSYGARTTLHALHAGNPISRAVLVALPTRLPANAAAMSNLLLGRRIRAEQFEETPDLDLLEDPPCPVLVVAGDRDPLVQPAKLREHGQEPVLIEGVNHFFSRRLGNQPPLPTDLDALCRTYRAWLERSD